MTVFATVVSRHLAGAEAATAATTAGIRAVFWTGAGFAVLGTLITLAVPELPLRTTDQ
jgi:hypothetical protein